MPPDSGVVRTCHFARSRRLTGTCRPRARSAPRPRSQARAGLDPETGSVSLTGPTTGAVRALVYCPPWPAVQPRKCRRPCAINVDRNDGHVTITSDPLPQIVGGAQFDGAIPLRLRDVSVTINRPSFIVNRPVARRSGSARRSPPRRERAHRTESVPGHRLWRAAIRPKMRMQVTATLRPRTAGIQP